ncbi:hypothetical protein FACS1894122_11910 [Alphaproteobacteria bacterium]|nr:hypothetical protein FACS1894122_11910 [Alphaproteobacteria bacterium]
MVDFIYESCEAKSIYAIANDHAFSAAYAIASAASKIFVNRTSGVGTRLSLDPFIFAKTASALQAHLAYDATGSEALVPVRYALCCGGRKK